MNLRPEEISSVIKEQIKNYHSKFEIMDYGTVLQVGDGIARVYGLSGCMEGELLEFDSGVHGMALNLEEDNVGVVILGADREIKEGDIVKPTGEVVEVPVGETLIGRVVDALGQPIDGKGPIVTREKRPIEYGAPGVLMRKSVNERAHYRRPSDRQNRDRHRHHSQPKGKRCYLYLRRDRTEKIHHRAAGADAGRARGDEVHHRRFRNRQRCGVAAIHRAIRRLRDGGAFYVSGQGCTDRLR